MLRILFHALAVLHLGPGIAFALLAFGCDDGAPALGAACSATSPMTFFIVTTLVGWVVLGAASAWFLRRSPASDDAGPAAG
jgi:predicted cobalt transporter CbtA